MDQDRRSNSGCLFPFGDDFLPIFMFFFHLNDPDPLQSQIEEEEEEDKEGGES